MAIREIILVGVNHYAPFIEKNRKIHLEEVEKAAKLLKSYLRPGDRLGLDIPQFRIEMFNLYEKAINGVLPEKFKLPEGFPKAKGKLRTSS